MCLTVIDKVMPLAQAAEAHERLEPFRKIILQIP
jgi:hypothetical protein